MRKGSLWGGMLERALRRVRAGARMSAVVAAGARGSAVVAAGLGLVMMLSSSPAFAADKTAATKKPAPVPNELQLLKSLKQTWAGVSCTGQLKIAVGSPDPLLTAPVAVSYQNDTLNWVAFVTPPAPCAGSVVLGGMKVGPGNKPAVSLGVPPSIVKGGQAATLSWKRFEKKEEVVTSVNAGSLCGADAGSQEGMSNLFSGFTGGQGTRPDTIGWDADNPNLLKLQGNIKGETKAQRGAYMIWLDKNKGYLPVKTQRFPEQGAAVTTTYQAKEIKPGHWLPVRWEVSGAGRPTMVGEVVDLRCDRPLPAKWFDAKSYPDVASQTATIKAIQGK